MSWLLGLWRILKGVPWQVWVVLALFAAFFAWGERQYSNGYDKRVAEEAEEQRQAEIEQERKRKEAEERDRQAKNQGDKVITDRRKDLDDAKQGIPDQGLTDRQRARACAELQRQGRKCPPATPAR